ncbi:MAG: hypothetical protein WCO48_00010 [Candidatus Taylorbacteria bacterium]
MQLPLTAAILVLAGATASYGLGSGPPLTKIELVVTGDVGEKSPSFSDAVTTPMMLVVTIHQTGIVQPARSVEMEHDTVWIGPPPRLVWVCSSITLTTSLDTGPPDLNLAVAALSDKARIPYDDGVSQKILPKDTGCCGVFASIARDIIVAFKASRPMLC